MALDRRLLNKTLADNKAAGVTWWAGETSMLHLTADERKLRLGYVPGPGELSLEKREQLAADIISPHPIPYPYGLPQVWTWTFVNGGRNFLPDIKDQGNCGSCVAFGTAAAIDGMMRVAMGIAANDPNAGDLQDVSEAQMFYCGAEQQGRTCAGPNAGWWVGAALQYAMDPGVAPESCFPYTAGDQGCGVCAGWQSQVTQIAPWEEPASPAAMKAALASIGPLITVFRVYEDFYSYKGGVYAYNGSAPFVGGHCVCVVGYDEPKQAWICRNSWGPGWGEGGYFYIGYGQCGIDALMWSITSFKTIYHLPQDSVGRTRGPKRARLPQAKPLTRKKGK
jgi:hypothetical protein